MIPSEPPHPVKATALMFVDEPPATGLQITIELSNVALWIGDAA